MSVEVGGRASPTRTLPRPAPVLPDNLVFLSPGRFQNLILYHIFLKKVVDGG